MQEETFFTTIGCMDGRVQEVVDAFGRETFGANYPDTITDAGIVGKISKRDEKVLAHVRFELIDVSLKRHKSVGVVVHGHTECAGNPVSDEIQKEDIKQSVTIIRELVPQLPVIGVFVHRDGEHPDKWVAEKL